jgi:hypothetical protein
MNPNIMDEFRLYLKKAAQLMEASNQKQIKINLLREELDKLEKEQLLPFL